MYENPFSQLEGNPDSTSVISNFIDVTQARKSYYEIINNPTGINIIDALTASVRERKDDPTNPNIECGLSNRLISLTGPSGTGKSSIAIQIGWDIIRKHIGGLLFLIDFEGNTPPQRLMNITNLSSSELVKRCIYASQKSDLLDTLNDIMAICGEREEHKDKLQYNTGLYNMYGEEVKKYPPLVVIIDSIAAINVNRIDELKKTRSGEVQKKDNIYKNTDGFNTARSVKTFFENITPLQEKYNVIVIAINHETQAPTISMGPFQIPTKIHPHAKIGTTIKGGNEIVFKSYSWIELKIKEAINPERNNIYGDKVRGNFIQLRFIKNKNAASNIATKLIFHPDIGYLTDLSDFEFLVSENIGISGSPHGFRLDIYPEVTFTRKTIFDLVRSDYIFARALYMTARTMMFYKYVFNSKPPDFIKLVKNVDFNFRIAVIMSYSSDYAINNNLNINDEILQNIIPYVDKIDNFSNNWKTIFRENQKSLELAYSLDSDDIEMNNNPMIEHSDYFEDTDYFDEDNLSKFEKDNEL